MDKKLKLSKEDFANCCHFCQHRHSGCTTEDVHKAYETGECKNFIPGKCYYCAIEQSGTQKEQNGICFDAMYPSGCPNFKEGYGYEYFEEEMFKQSIYADTTSNEKNSIYVHDNLKKKHSRKLQNNRNIKKSRMDKCGKRHYGYKYYIKDEKDLYETFTEEVPAQIKTYYHLEHIKIPYINKKGKVKYYDKYKRVEDGYEILPKRTVKKRKYIGKQKVTPYLKRWSDSNLKKYYKRYASKKLRRRPVETENLNKAGFKKLFDMKWTLY